MTAPVDPEIKAMRSIVRALETLPEDDDNGARRRIILWLVAVEFGTSQCAVELRLTSTALQPMPKRPAWTGIPT